MKTGIAGVALLLAAGLAGCQWFAPRPEPVPGQAEVTVYRPGRLTAFSRSYTVELDGRAVAELANGSYFRIGLAPGTHSFGIAGKPGLVWSETLAADGRYYLQLDVRGLAPDYELALRRVEAAQAQAELKDLRELAPAAP